MLTLHAARAVGQCQFAARRRSRAQSWLRALPRLGRAHRSGSCARRPSELLHVGSHGIQRRALKAAVLAPSRSGSAAGPLAAARLRSPAHRFLLLLDACKSAAAEEELEEEEAAASRRPGLPPAPRRRPQQDHRAAPPRPGRRLHPSGPPLPAAGRPPAGRPVARAAAPGLATPRTHAAAPFQDVAHKTRGANSMPASRRACGSRRSCPRPRTW
jgi:hypothetical protein